MKTTLYSHSLPVLASIALLPFTALAQEDFDPAKMEEVVKKYGTPGEEHKAFRAMTGNWKAENTYWMMPGADPMTSSGEAKVRLLLGGRYLSEQYKSESPEFGTFQGQGTLAYDRLAKEYVQTWIDTMGTGIMISRGKLADDGKSIVMHSTFKDPMTMQDLKYRTVSHLGDKQQRKMEMFVTYPGKEEYKLMQIVYTKAAAAKKKKADPKSKAKVEE